MQTLRIGKRNLPTKLIRNNIISNMYRIPLKYICDLGKMNFPAKIDLKIRCTLQTEMKNLFESKTRLLPLAHRTRKLFFLGHCTCNMNKLKKKNFRQYFETIKLSSKVLRMGIQKTPTRKRLNYSVNNTVLILIINTVLIL